MWDTFFMEHRHWAWPGCQHPAGLQGDSHKVFCGRDISLRGTKRPGMRTFPDNPPVSLLGLVMAPKASCSWKTQQPPSWEVPLEPHLIRLNSSEGGRGCPFPCASAAPAVPWPLSGRLLGTQGGISWWRAIPNYLSSLLYAREEIRVWPGHVV